MTAEERVALAERAWRHGRLGRYDQNEVLRRMYGEDWLRFRLAVDAIDAVERDRVVHRVMERAV